MNGNAPKNRAEWFNPQNLLGVFGFLALAFSAYYQFEDGKRRVADLEAAQKEAARDSRDRERASYELEKRVLILEQRR